MQLLPLIKLAGYTRAELCKAMGYKPLLLKSIIDGEQKPSPKAICDLAAFLGITQEQVRRAVGLV
jgi:transcriptional regulator with XRE-family HTH domain